jgi:hypothetical protein
VTAFYVIASVLLIFAQISTVFMIYHFGLTMHKGLSETARHLNDLFDIIEGNRVMTKQEYDIRYGRLFADKGQKPTDL